MSSVSELREEMLNPAIACVDIRGVEYGFTQRASFRGLTQ
jgi:hypothetical protein